MKIENITFAQAMDIAEEVKTIKNYTVVFADLKKHMSSDFGYSALVFKNEKHIHYADEYELHWQYYSREYGKELLKQHLAEILNNKLYTDEELMGEINNYAEYKLKSYFLRNYWIMQYDHISIFNKEEMENKGENAIYNPISFCYVYDISIIEEQKKLLENIEREYKKLTENDDTFRQMVRTELCNHEACITGDYTEALSALGFKYENLTEHRQKIVDEELREQIFKYNC